MEIQQSHIRGVMKDILVSISCTTYNHAKYIRQALNGFLIQETNFSFEILIHDDASTDETTEIIKEYEKKYPNKIRPIYQIENQYSKGVKVFFKEFERAKGKYIAVCEGDDYWTDPLKLQKQVDFLEKNEEYGLVHTAYKVIDEKGNKIKHISRLQKSGDVCKDIIKGDYNLVTASTMFRAIIIREKYYEDSLNTSFKMGDLPLWIIISKNYKVKYLNDVTTAYRILTYSASHDKDLNKYINFHKSAVEARKYYSILFNINVDFNFIEQSFNLAILKECWQKARLSEAFHYYKKIITTRPFGFKRNCKATIFFLFSLLKVFSNNLRNIFMSKEKNTKISNQ